MAAFRKQIQDQCASPGRLQPGLPDSVRNLSLWSSTFVRQAVLQIRMLLQL